MAEEIVRIIKVDTKNSGKSIKDLRDEIKSLRTELEKTEVGTEEFESTLKQLTQTQKSYNEVQQQIRDLSRTNQQDMVKFASFAKNLGKSYSALNAAIGLFADKNEDVQKAMLKVQRTIQLIQGLDGVTGLIRDIPKVVAGFKSWLNALNPIERQVDRIAKGINGIDPAKLRAINEANRAGQGGTTTTATAAAGGREQVIPAENKELATRANTIYPALLQQEKDLNKERLNAIKNLEKQKEALSVVEDTYTKISNAMKLISAAGTDQETMIKSFNAEMQRLGVNLKLEEASMQNIVGIMTEQRQAVNEAAEAIDQIDDKIAKLRTEIEAAEVGMSKFEKTVPRLAKGLKALGGIMKTALYSIGVGLAIAAVVKLIDYVGKLIAKAGEWRRINKEIAESTNQISSKSIVVLKELSYAYNKLGDSAKAKQEFITKYAEKIKETGIEINNVQKAEDVFINNTDKYVKAIMARAKAQATENAAIKIYEDYLNQRYQLENEFKWWQKGLTALATPDAREAVANDFIEKNRKKNKEEIEKLDKEVEQRLKQMFETVAELEKEYAGMFTSVTSKSGGASTDWAKEYKEALDALKNYVQDYLDIFKDARTKELDDNRKAYEQNVKDINENFLKGVQAAQGNAKKLIELEDEKNKALKFAQLAYERQRLEIIDKYNDEVFEKQKAELDREYELLEKQLERNRRLYDTTNLREPKQVSYQTTYNQNPLPLGLGRNWMSVYQTKDQVEQQYKDQVKYNDEFLKLTQDRINNENKLLQDEIDTITEKAKVLKEQLDSTDLNDLEKRREIVDQLRDIDDTLFTNKQTIAENEIALDNAVLENQQANLDAYLDMQDKKKQALDGVLEVASTAAGALANIFRIEMNNDKLSEQQRERAMKAYKAFAITQAIADTWKGANEAYAAMASIPYVGPALGIAASAAAVIAGLANVRAIMSESMSSTSQTASVTAPAPMETAPIEYTRNLVGDKELDEINQPIRCYVLESDISKTQNKVKVTEMNATF